MVNAMIFRVDLDTLHGEYNAKRAARGSNSKIWSVVLQSVSNIAAQNSDNLVCSLKKAMPRTNRG